MSNHHNRHHHHSHHSNGSSRRQSIASDTVGGGGGNGDGDGGGGGRTASAVANATVNAPVVATASASTAAASYETTESYSYLSETEAAILRSDVPIYLPDGEHTEEITVNGQKGLWVNRQEIVNWRGPIPITAYEINQDPNPEVIRKRTAQQINYIQEVFFFSKSSLTIEI